MIADFKILQHVRLAWGVPVPSWAEKYESRFGHRIIELYGSVEAGVPVMQTGPRVPGSCGTVLSGVSTIFAEIIFHTYSNFTSLA